MSKIQQVNSENYVFKRKGNVEQFKVNTKIVNKMKEARSLLTETQGNNENTAGAMRNISEGKGEINASARFLASIIGQIIYMQGAVGPVVRLRTRSMYECILYRESWNANVLLNSRSLDEIVFWKENIEKINGRELHIVEQYSSVVYTDASGIGYGGYLVKATDEENMGSRHDVEKLKSSTWRELEAVYRVLQSISFSLQGQTVKWHRTQLT
ncbi:unnamed protein product [Mytilus coruscus]|uniref:Uncharacterized protein n=1 Tax=Mytilus coruscus TaxID=42192 RepID=A0A6J8E592_MYTCO|nr:unnamed protein product [Mytilus coruscus]